MTTPLVPDEVPAFSTPPSYRSYLLRFWQERGAQPAHTVWRFSVEDPLTDKRLSFADLETLIHWLETEIGAGKVAAASLPENPEGGDVPAK